MCHRVMEERELTFFTSSNFPPGGYAVPDEHKNGAYFVQGRSQFFFFFCEESRTVKGLQDSGRRRPGEISARSLASPWCTVGAHRSVNREFAHVMISCTQTGRCTPRLGVCKVIVAVERCTCDDVYIICL